MKTIVLSEKEWAKIHHRLAVKYKDKPSVMLLKPVMKRELGFVVRRHREWSEDNGYRETIRLDFYSDEMETLFRLTYL